MHITACWVDWHSMGQEIRWGAIISSQWSMIIQQWEIIHEITVKFTFSHCSSRPSPAHSGRIGVLMIEASNFTTHAAVKLFNVVSSKAVAFSQKHGRISLRRGNVVQIFNFNGELPFSWPFSPSWKSQIVFLLSDCHVECGFKDGCFYWIVKQNVATGLLQMLLSFCHQWQFEKYNK